MRFLHSISYCLLFLTSARADVTVEQASATANEVVDDKSIALEHRGQTSFGSYRVYDHRPCIWFEYRGKPHIIAGIDATSGALNSYERDENVSSRDKVTVTLEQARNNALKFLRRGHILPDDTLLEDEAKFLNHGAAGREYTFEWRRVINNIQYPESLDIHVNAATGNVTDLTHFGEAVRLTNLKPKLSSEQALAANQTISNLLPGWRVISSRLAVRRFRRDDLLSLEWLVWTYEIEGMRAGDYIPIAGQYAYAYILHLDLSAETGRPLGEFDERRVEPERHIMLRPPVPQPKRYIAGDTWPCWTSDSAHPIYFRSNRAIAHKGGSLNRSEQRRYKEYLRDHGFVPARLSKAGLEALIIPSGFMNLLATSSASESLMFTVYDEPYTLYLATGGVAPCTDSRQRGILEGRIPSPDSKWIAFSQRDEESYESPNPMLEHNASIYVVRLTGKGKETGTPIKIVGRLPFVKRLSWFPDNQRLLVCYDDTNNGEDVMSTAKIARWPDVLDIRTKKLIPLNLPALLDPDLPEGRQLAFSDAVLDLTGTRIAFSALRWSGNPKDDAAYCIYTCKLHGSDLKRITPPTAQPMLPWRYPQHGVTVFNAWEKLLFGTNKR